MLNKIYHERQNRQLCALHCLNNLFQARNTFTKEELDEICMNLSPNQWINPHKSMLGLGNYDINVIMTALQLRNCDVVWFDKRKDPSCIDLNSIIGFILNVPSDFKFGFVFLPLKRRHWIAIRRIFRDPDIYYNLDSKLNAPERIGNESELLTYLRAQLDTKERELFIVVEQQTASKAGNNDNEPRWLKSGDSVATTATTTTTAGASQTVNNRSHSNAIDQNQRRT